MLAETRPSRVPPLGSSITERVVTLTQTAPPTEATPWTSAMMAKVVGISASSVQRIWRAHGLQPHRVKQFKLSTDPNFVDKLHDVVGPRHHHPVCRLRCARRQGHWTLHAEASASGVSPLPQPERGQSY